MMDDQEIQALLEKYRPAPPPAGLQARVERAIDQSTDSIHRAPNAPSHQRTWPWTAAAAALLAIAIVLHGRATAPTLPTPVPNVSQLADGLGGGEAAFTMAGFILSSPMTAGNRALEEPWASTH